jgi:hypothetical protein
MSSTLPNVHSTSPWDYFGSDDRGSILGSGGAQVGAASYGGLGNQDSEKEDGDMEV